MKGHFRDLGGITILYLNYISLNVRYITFPLFVIHPNIEQHDIATIV